MGRRGPAPAPTRLKLVKGERTDRINDAEPVPADGEIRCPAYLGRAATAIWKQYAPDLIAKKVLSTWDIENFAGWCAAVARRNHAERMLEDEGELVERNVFNRNGECTGTRIVKNEWLLVWKDANDVVLRVGARFGLTPSDRSQLKVGDGAGKKKGEDFFT